MVNRLLSVGYGAMLLCFLIYGVAFCQEVNTTTGQFDGIEALIEILRDKGVLTDEEARQYIERYRQAEPLVRKEKPVIMLVPEEKEELLERITEDVTTKLREDVEKVEKKLEVTTDDLMGRSTVTKRNLKALDQKVSDDLAAQVYKSSWAQRIRWGGDIRLRYQHDFYDENNAILLNPRDPTEQLNTTEDRPRWRYRMRLGVKAKILDPREVNAGKVEVGIELATGNEDNPVSPNDTLGDYSNKDSVIFDQAYLEWTYQPELPIWGNIPEVSLAGGRTPNPWFYSNLVWDDDLNFDGVFLNLKTDTLASNPWHAFLTGGVFPVQEVEFSHDDKWLYAGQVGFEYNRPMGLSAKLGVAYYYYENIKGVQNTSEYPELYDYTAPLFQQKGNTLIDIDPGPDIKTALAADYRLLNVTGKLDYDYWYPIHIILLGDYVKNLGYDRDEVLEKTGSDQKETVGYQVGLTVGYPRIQSFGDWNCFLFYKRVEADAVLDAFTDSDFHDGGTNAKGWVLGGEFGLYENVWLKGRWITTDEIEGPPFAIDTLLLDMNARF